MICLSLYTPNEASKKALREYWKKIIKLNLYTWEGRKRKRLQLVLQYEYKSSALIICRTHYTNATYSRFIGPIL